jgi:multiple sugar transport system permease protein
VEATTTRRPGVQEAGARPARRFADNERQLAVWFLLPSIVYVVVLVAVPFFLAIGFAFSDVTAGDPSFHWAGLQTFQRALDDPVFWRALRNTFVFTVVSMALIVVLGKVLANILVADFRGKWLVRFLVLLPWTTPVALSAVAWLWMLDSVYSPIDWVLRHLGLLDGNVYWLGRPGLAMASVIAVHVWRLTPLSAVIILAGLVAIPRDIEEAARVDGAGAWQVFRHITFPVLKPILLILATLSTIWDFKVFTQIWVMLNQRPSREYFLLGIWSYSESFGVTRYGKGAAIAVVMVLLLMLLTSFYVRQMLRAVGP